MADVVHCANVRVIEFGDCARFAFESLPDIFALMHCTRKDLHGDGPLQSCVFSAINFPHAARAQRSNNQIRTKSVTCGQHYV
jgi:hypothetical protein